MRLAVILSFAALAASGPAHARDDMFGAWSPKGDRIAFMSDRDGDPEIYVVPAAGGEPRRLTRTPGRDAHPSFSPDGRRIVFQSPRHGGQTRVFVMDAAKGEAAGPPTVLARTMGFCGVAVWSPDGRQIAFQCASAIRGLGGEAARWRIWLMGSDGRNLRPVTRGPGNDQVPSWRPDGKALVFHSDRSGVDQLHELDLATGRDRPLSAPPGAHWAGSRTPAGDLLYVSNRDGGDGDVYQQPADGPARRLTTNGPRFGLPLLSPSGREVLYQALTPQGLRLEVIDLGSGEAREVPSGG